MVGLGANGLQFMLLAKRRNAGFDKTIMLGRQNHYLNAAWVKLLLDRFGLPITETEAEQLVAEPYAEALIKRLGAAVVDSMDASAYEAATIVHDLNQPLPRSLVRQYTCVLESGTLEHVFNFPVALKSATDLLDVGGTLLTITPCSNFMGHGFYQFSPELYYNYLLKNGFVDVEIYMTPYRWFPYLFHVSNPEKVGSRVELVSPEPWQMCVIARKARHLDETVVPIQSDYQNLSWQGKDVDRSSEPPPVDAHLSAAVSDLKARIAALTVWPETVSPHFIAGFENRRHYQLMDPAKD